jgi:KDO2-lipid IV(A) lauroyltransferase
MYVVLYRVFGYRKQVVRSNLEHSFPEKSTEELTKIQEGFYRFFCDLIVETLKTLSIGKAKLMQMVQYGDMDVFGKYYKEGRSVIIVMGHFGNWELAGARFSQDPFHQLYVIYHPLSNPYADRLMYRMRTRLGNKLYSMKDTFRGMIRNRDNLTATAFIADQTPSPEGAYWTSFLHQDTPIFTGTAKISKKLNLPVIYVSVLRPERGSYIIVGEELVADPKQFT